MKIILLLIIIFSVVTIPIWWVSGVVLSFQASPITGIIALVAEPAPFVVGVVNLLWHRNIAEEFTEKFIDK